MVLSTRNQWCIRWLMCGLCALGFVLSYYAFYVETTKEKNEEYTAMCDISEHISCSAVFTSRFGKGFGLLNYFVDENSILYQPNSVYGMLFYPFLALIAQSNSTFLVCMESIAITFSCITSLYLAYILYFVLYDLCVVCVTTYIINGLLLICSMYKLNSVFGLFKKKLA